MKTRIIFLMASIVFACEVKAQDQFYSTVDVTANILEVAYDSKLVGSLNSGSVLVSGVRGSSINGASWYYTYYSSFMWLKLNKTVSCFGQDVENFIFLPMQFSKIDTNSYPSYAAVTPWQADADQPADYVFFKNMLTAAYLNSSQIRFSRVVCGASQLHPVRKQLVPVAYIQGPQYFTIIPQATNSLSNSAWVNGVQVTPTNSAPTNAITTTWNFTAPTASNYDVYAHWVSNKNAVSAISYGVDGQAMKNVALDQNINAGIWVKLIKNTPYSVGNHTINIAIDSTANYVVDGIKVEKTSP